MKKRAIYNNKKKNAAQRGIKHWLMMLCVSLLTVTLSVMVCFGAESSFKKLPLSEQIKIRESWLEKHHGMILDIMRRFKIAMWIVVTEEFHPDPLVEYIAPPRPDVGNRDFFVFIDTGDKGLRKIAITSYPEENLKKYLETFDQPKPAEEILKELVKTYNPKNIALSIDGRRGPTRSLTYDSYKFLAEKLGHKYKDRFVPAEDIIEAYLDTRLPEEKPIFEQLVIITDEMGRRALSNEVITPGRTTAGDIRNWLYDQIGAYGLSTWFQPDIRIQRKGMKNPMARGFLAVAPEQSVIQPGDLVHLDFGLSYMGLSSDWQKMAYVLNPGETDAPEGLRKALANTNKLQDSICRNSQPGRLNSNVYEDTMKEMEKLGINAQIYSHALGAHGHGIGPNIDFRAKQRKDMKVVKPLRAGSYFAIELNTKLAIPQWDNQEVFIMEEDPAWLSDKGWVFFVPRQEHFFLVNGGVSEVQ